MSENFDFSHLNPEEFHILREAGTERAWSGEYNKHYSDGIYNCRGCGQQLFSSDTKFDSGSGWPSFDQALTDAVIEKEDSSYGMTRVEVQCSRCKSHLGHVFPDGPRNTTGQRYCMNSLSLKFEDQAKNISK
ncbi:MAG: peptide-methionine (R)-S-oxide reductase MsrB [SAR324 cluster bacterium]|nr:peptide-methionine (R)-S-oxide reductase MsrB [SAR324 cluster bacterium]